MTNALFSVRAAVVLLLSLLAGLGAGALTRAAGEPWPRAILAGFAATGGAIVLFNGIIARPSAGGGDA